MPLKEKCPDPDCCGLSITKCNLNKLKQSKLCPDPDCGLSITKCNLNKLKQYKLYKKKIINTYDTNDDIEAIEKKINELTIFIKINK